MGSKVLLGIEAKKKIFEGIKTICDAVKVTLGPKGRNVILEQGGMPLITNDGYTIAKNIVLDDKFEQMGAKIIFEASAKTNEDAGDGTTTACVLAEALIKEGMQNYYLGLSPIDLGNGMKLACKDVVAELERQSRKIESNLDIKQVATISCGDDEIGNLIAKAFEIVGYDGVINLEESNKLSTTLEIVDGFKFSKGYMSGYMSTNLEKQICEMDNVKVIVTDEKIDNINDILHILEIVMQKGLKLLLIAQDYSEDVIASLVMNKLRANLNVVAVKAPSFGGETYEILEDICINVGATLISKRNNLELTNIEEKHFGQCKKILINKHSTTIFEGYGDKKVLNYRINLIKEEIKKATDDYKKKLLTQRLSKLKNSVAIIKVGGLTDVECTEKKLRIEDALSATKSAIEEGVVIGGGCALVKCINFLKDRINYYDEKFKVGAKIVLKSLEAPLRQIAKNCGEDDGIVLQNVKFLDAKLGFNAFNNSFENLEDVGIIDPKKVTRSALENAVSVAYAYLTMECAVLSV